MDWDWVFGAAGQVAVTGWIALLLLPRHRFVLFALRNGAVLALAVLYAGLILATFTSAEGGGFGTIAEVRALFASDPVLVAGWVHYLAFDLLVGTWIAEAADRARISRIIQAPILAATFLFGPLGYALYQATAAVRSGFAGRRAVPT